MHAGYLYAVKCIDKRVVKVRRAVKLILNERKALETCDSPFLPKLRYAFQTCEVPVFLVLAVECRYIYGVCVVFEFVHVYPAYFLSDGRHARW
jgi:serine/threonine protein kinase